MIERTALAHLQSLLATQDSRDVSLRFDQGAKLKHLRSFLKWPAFLTRTGDRKGLKASLSSRTLSRTTPTPNVKSP
jgi:hypothetical protein